MLLLVIEIKIFFIIFLNRALSKMDKNCWFYHLSFILSEKGQNALTKQAAGRNRGKLNVLEMNH